MSEAAYEVVFHGTLATGETRESVQPRLARLFNVPEERLDALFSGRAVVVRKQVDEATANRFAEAFRQAGAECEIRPVDGDRSGAEAGYGRSQRASAANTAAGGQPSAPADDPNATVVERPVPADTGELALAPLERYTPPPDDTPAPDIDTSGFELAEPGGRLVEPDDDREPPAIDTAHLELVPLEAEEEAGGHDD